MEITSGATGGPRPDPSLDAIGLTVYAATLSEGISLSETASGFVGAGWSARKSAWNEYEVAQTWAELPL